MAGFNVISFNCNGLGEKIKRQKVFTYLKEKLRNGVIFLQETHSTDTSEKEWKSQWGGEIFFSHGSSNSTGCAIAFSENFSVNIVNLTRDSFGRLLILECSINDELFLFINLYNANSESDQLSVLEMLASKLDSLDCNDNCKPIFGGDLNLIFDTNLDASGGNPSLKKRSLASLMKIINKLDVSDIFRIRYPHLKRFTFHRKNPIIQRRLDYLFTANLLQESIGDVIILPSFMSDHSPISISINTLPSDQRGKYGWKFNNSLLHDESFPALMRNHIISLHSVLGNLDNPHLKWEYVKYEARKFSIAYSKHKNKEEVRLKAYHENIVNQYTSTENRPPDIAYAESKIFLDSFF